MNALGTAAQPNADFWRGRRVLVTGHTGFKGGWLCLWLQHLGAHVAGFSLAPPTAPSLFDIARVGEGMSSVIGDIRDAAALKACFDTVQPEIVLHLAAQPLVRRSYREPTDTFSTNVMGLINVLETVRATPSVRSVLNVTTDKCYRNPDNADTASAQTAFRENDPLGGHDPYSSSKACAEIVSAAWRDSFLTESNIALATARAGNVIGGGDWAEDRLVPDLLRAFDRNETLTLRYPHAVRPWQHVLEPLCGYLLLAERLNATDNATRNPFATAWNFGPVTDDERTVGDIVSLASQRWRDGDVADNNAIPLAQHDNPAHEAATLRLDSTQAHNRLSWTPRWRIQTALARTIEWHRAWRKGCDMRAQCLSQIDGYIHIL
jgi:CDP-glucose 4,6-dehydratase